jgi:WD40 repeat protein
MLVIVAAAVVSACITPHFRHLEHVEDVQRVLAKQTTREGVRDKLGPPGIVDTPQLYVYDWEKAKALAWGYYSMAPLGHTGTRALFVFDEDGHIARSEIVGTGQGEKGNTGSVVADLSKAAAAPPPSKECADKSAVGAWFVGAEPRLILQLTKGIRVCDASGSRVIANLPKQYMGFTPSPDGRFAAAWNKEKSLMLRDGSTLELLWLLEPPSPVGMSVARWGAAISFSADGSRLAAQLGSHGVAVYDTATGDTVLRMAGRWSPYLSPDGKLLVSKAKTGAYVTEVDTGRDIAERPLPEYPYGISNNASLARMLLVRLGTVAFSGDGRRLATASCAHAEVWDLATMLSSNSKRGLEDAFLLPFSNVFGVCVASVAFSSDGSTLAVTNEGTVTLYDLVEHRIEGSYALPVIAIYPSFTSDLTRAAFLAPAGTLIWEVGKVVPPTSVEKPTPPPEIVGPLGAL